LQARYVVNVLSIDADVADDADDVDDVDDVGDADDADLAKTLLTFVPACRNAPRNETNP
jgi:hypothetical protein